jgi:hypothetical protein
MKFNVRSTSADINDPKVIEKGAIPADDAFLRPRRKIARKSK